MSLIIEIIFIIVLLFIVILNIRLRSIYKELKNIPNEKNISGFEIIRTLSNNEPHIIKKKGMFLDYYDSDRNTIKLSDSVFDGEDIYASLVATNISYETTDISFIKSNKFSSIMILISYIIIILGAFLSNTNIINFGLILFVLAFIYELYILSNLNNNEEYNKLIDKIKKNKLILKEQSKNDFIIIITLMRLATLPYSFVKYFR